MSVCQHTGLAIPECSCTACIRAQLDEHMPSLDGETDLAASESDSGPKPPAEQQRAA